MSRWSWRAMASTPGPGFTAHHLLDGPYVVVLPAGHRLAGQEEVDLDDLADERWVDNDFARGWCRANLIEACTAAGFSPAFRVEARDSRRRSPASPPASASRCSPRSARHTCPTAWPASDWSARRRPGRYTWWCTTRSSTHRRRGRRSPRCGTPPTPRTSGRTRCSAWRAGLVRPAVLSTVVAAAHHVDVGGENPVNAGPGGDQGRRRLDTFTRQARPEPWPPTRNSARRLPRCGHGRRVAESGAG